MRRKEAAAGEACRGPSGIALTTRTRAVAAAAVLSRDGRRAASSGEEAVSTTMEQGALGDVAGEVLNALYWDFALPRHCIVVRSEGGWVTLTGEVRLPAQLRRSRRAASARRGRRHQRDHCRRDGDDLRPMPESRIARGRGVTADRRPKSRVGRGFTRKGRTSGSRRDIAATIGE